MNKIRVKLEWYDPNEEQECFFEGELPITFGRLENNHVMLKSSRVSRNHAQLVWQEDKLLLADLNSSNGIIIGNKRFQNNQVEVQEGSQFTIDPFEFIVSAVYEVTPEPEPPRRSAMAEQTFRFTLPPPLNKISDRDGLTLMSFMENVSYAAGEFIFHQGDDPDGFYIIDSGLVRIELDHEVSNPDDHDDVFAFIEPNSVLGELGLLDNAPRSANAVAHTDVKARRVSVEAFEALMKEHPNIAISLTLALGNSAALKLRQTTARLDSLISAKSDPRVEEMISKAQAAQRQILEWSEERIDQLLHALAAAIYEQAEPLAQAAVQETGIGNVADKVIKNKVASLGVYQSLAGQRGFGLMPADPKGGKVYDLAHPMGVIFGLVPVTNPTSTFIFKTLICLKSRNALILSPNRRAAGVSNQMGEIIRGVLREHGASENMVQWVDARANRKLTVTFMGHSQIALILATGGPSMVKAAYSSGNPAIGVGSGNAPVLITRTADLEHAARSVVLSKSFDYGLICGSEHNLVVEEAVLPAFTQQLEKAGAAILNPTEAKMLLSQVIDPKINGLREIVVGQDPAKIAAFFKFQRPYPIRLLVVPSGEINADNPMAREKMAPILSLFTVRDAEEGLAVSRKLLSFDGQGHTAIIYSTDEALIERFGLEMPASRILVNSPGAHGVVGISTSLIPSLTLGCGTFGGTSTTDNVTFRNLVNVKRLAYFTPERFAALAEL